MEIRKPGSPSKESANQNKQIRGPINPEGSPILQPHDTVQRGTKNSICIMQEVPCQQQETLHDSSKNVESPPHHVNLVKNQFIKLKRYPQNLGECIEPSMQTAGVNCPMFCPTNVEKMEWPIKATQQEWISRTNGNLNTAESKSLRPFKLFYKHLRRTLVQQRLASRTLNEVNYTYRCMSGERSANFLDRYYQAAYRYNYRHNYDY